MAIDRLQAPHAELLSPHVSGSHYFFLTLSAQPASGGLLVLGGREHCDPGYSLDRKNYAYYVIEYVAEGAGAAELDGQRTELMPGSLFATRPSTHCIIRTDPARPLLKYFLCVSNHRFESRWKKARLPFAKVAQIGAHGDVRNVFEQIIREGRHAGESTRQISELLLDVLLLKIADGLSQPARPTDAARDNFLRCKALIDAQPECIHSLEELAASAGLDASSICRLFRRFQGTSPYQYLLRCKMNLAAEHLLGTGMLVKEAAQRVGFADAYHFSRCFKTVHGVAPRELRLRS